MDKIVPYSASIRIAGWSRWRSLALFVLSLCVTASCICYCRGLAYIASRVYFVFTFSLLIIPMIDGKDWTS